MKLSLAKVFGLQRGLWSRCESPKDGHRVSELAARALTLRLFHVRNNRIKHLITIWECEDGFRLRERVLESLHHSVGLAENDVQLVLAPLGIETFGDIHHIERVCLRSRYHALGDLTHELLVELVLEDGTGGRNIRADEYGPFEVITRTDPVFLALGLYQRIKNGRAVSAVDIARNALAAKYNFNNALTRSS